MLATVQDVRIPAPAEPFKARKSSLPYSRALVNVNHAWEVVKDATGDFLGRRFPLMDLLMSAKMMTWPEGITFRHVKTGEYRVYSHGEILRMGQAIKPIYKLLFNGEVIYSSTQKRAPKSVLARYWPKIADDKEALDALATCPVESDGKRLEWKQEAG